MIIWAGNSAAWNSVNWYTWDEQMEQEVLVGHTPVQGDIVYANGYVITIGNTLNLGSGTLRNDKNPYTGITGGCFQVNDYYINVTANLKVGGFDLIRLTTQGGTGLSIVTGDIDCSESSYSAAYFTPTYTGGWYRNWAITGNITIGSGYVIGHATTGYNTYPTQSSITITGNIYGANASGALTYKGIGTLTINGNLEGKINKTQSATPTIGTCVISGNVKNNFCVSAPTTLTVGGNVETTNSNISATTFTISGNAHAVDSTISGTTLNITGTATADGGNSLISGTNISVNDDIYAINGGHISATTISIGKNIYYSNSRGTFGLSYQNMNIENPNTFVWKDITEPRVNPFIILTNYDINNTDQYPVPTNVKKDVPYAYEQLVGTYTPDFPPESVVMKGYHYDNDNKIGTMETSVETNTTINIYRKK